MNMGEAKAKRAVREAVVKGAQLNVGEWRRRCASCLAP